MQENKTTANDAADLKHPEEALNKPHWSRFKLQGKDRFLVKVHKATEVKTKSGLIARLDNDDYQSEAATGTIIALSPMSEEAKRDYPDVKVGAHIQVVPMTWTCFRVLGDLIATGNLEYIIAAYDWKSHKTLEEEQEEADREHRAAIAKYYAESAEACAATSTEPVPSRIIVR